MTRASLYGLTRNAEPELVNHLIDLFWPEKETGFSIEHVAFIQRRINVQNEARLRASRSPPHPGGSPSR